MNDKLENSFKEYGKLVFLALLLVCFHWISAWIAYDFFSKKLIRDARNIREVLKDDASSSFR